MNHRKVVMNHRKVVLNHRKEITKRIIITNRKPVFAYHTERINIYKTGAVTPIKNGVLFAFIYLIYGQIIRKSTVRNKKDAQPRNHPGVIRYFSFQISSKYRNGAFDRHAERYYLWPQKTFWSHIPMNEKTNKQNQTKIKLNKNKLPNQTNYKLTGILKTKCVLILFLTDFSTVVAARHR